MKRGRLFPVSSQWQRKELSESIRNVIIKKNKTIPKAKRRPPKTMKSLFQQFIMFQSQSQKIIIKHYSVILGGCFAASTTGGNECNKGTMKSENYQGILEPAGQQE